MINLLAAIDSLQLGLKQCLYNFIVMAAEFNGSSYYRANPFYQQGYIPDGALKNRKPPLQMGELPQGEQFFEPTNKKHFQRLGYYSTIAEQNIIHSKEASNNILPAKDKEYFRSLNINDIQGASTNTLISKGVKNRLKAKEELQKRAQQQREAEEYEKMSRIQVMEDDRKRIEAINLLKKNTQPNYHQLVKRMRTEEKEKQMLNPEQNHQEKNRIGQYPPQNSLTSRDPIQNYHKQLEQAQKEIEELQLQLSQVKSQKQKAKLDYQQRIRHQISAHSSDPSADISPVTNQNYSQNYHRQQTYQQLKNQPQSHHHPYKQNPEQYPSNNTADKLQLSAQQLRYLAKQRQRQIKDTINYHRQPNGTPKKDIEGKEYRAVSQADPRTQKIASSTSPINPRENRQQHRRFNPTFLSYGSPSIGLAGKNIVGY